MATLKTQIQIRRDTAANLANVVLKAGEPGYATDTKKLAIGDGSTKFSSLKDYGALPDLNGYVTLDTAQTITGDKTFTGKVVTSNDKFEIKANSNTDDSWIKLTNASDADYYAFGIRRPYNNYGLQLKIHPASGSDTYYDIWHAGNDGSGSGLDADLLDGKHASAFALASDIPSVSGLVTGPSSSTDNAITRFDGTTGKIIQNSTVTIDDSGNITLPDDATLKLNIWGTRFLTISGNNIIADMSRETGGWAGSFAEVKDPSGTTTTMLGWLGGSTLTHIYMGGAYNDPYMKMTAAGLFTFKNQVTINAAQGTAPLKVTSTTVNTNLNADLLDGKHASEFALTSDIPTDTGMTSVTVTGGGNAVTSASYNNSTRQLTLTKGTSFLPYNPNYIEMNINGGIRSIGGYIDFHFHDSNGNPTNASGTVVADGVDYSSRIIESAPGSININNVTFKAGSTTASSFVKNGSSDSYVLLGGGGHKALSEFTGTTYGADRGISLVSGKFGHSNTAITAQSTKGLYKISYDAYGHITGTESFTLPTVNNGTLTIQKNGSTVATFTANQSGNTTANITVPSPTDYYWANVKVSSASSTATTPSVRKIGITGSTTTTAPAAVIMEYDSTYKALKFVFA